MNSEVFNGIVGTCQVHAKRLNWAMTELASKKPFSRDTIQQLTDMDLAIFDQFTARFSKLQGAMGAKFLPSIIELTHEEGELSSFIDKLNRLEKNGAIKSADQWLKLREIGNQFSHDYADDPEIQASLLNKAFDMAEKFLETPDRVVIFSKKYL